MDKKTLRTFGLLWAFIFFVIALFPFLKGHDLLIWPVFFGVFFLITSLIYPQLYRIIYFYQSWIRFGDLMGKINSKIIIFILFYFLFFPIGIFLKIFRKDLLGKRIDKRASSYFIDRKVQPLDMKNQF